MSLFMKDNGVAWVGDLHSYGRSIVTMMDDMLLPGAKVCSRELFWRVCGGIDVDD